MKASTSPKLSNVEQAKAELQKAVKTFKERGTDARFLNENLTSRGVDFPDLELHFVNPQSKSKFPRYSAEDLTDLVKDDEYMKNWKYLVGLYFETLGVKFDGSEPSSGNPTLPGSGGAIRFQRITSSMQLIIAATQQLAEDEGTTPEDKQKYQKLSSSLRADYMIIFRSFAPKLSSIDGKDLQHHYFNDIFSLRNHDARGRFPLLLDKAEENYQKLHDRSSAIDQKHGSYLQGSSLETPAADKKSAEVAVKADNIYKCNYIAKPYGILGTDFDYDNPEKGETAGNSDGLKNRRNFVIVDPAGAAFKRSAGKLGGSGASGAIYGIMGNEGKTIAESRPTFSEHEEKKGITKNASGLITTIQTGHAVFNNVWKPGKEQQAPAGVIHAVGPEGGSGEERERFLTETLKNIFIEYHNCTLDSKEDKATDLSGQKPGLRIPAISGSIYAGTDEQSSGKGGATRHWLSGGQDLYNKRLKTAIEQGYIQACKELKLKKIDFGPHGLEICSYSQDACDAFKRAEADSATPDSDSASASPPAPDPELPKAPKLLGETAKEVFEKAWRYVYGKAGAEGEEEEAAPATAEQRAFLRDQLSIIALSEEENKRNLLEELLKGDRQSDATELLGYLLEAVTEPKIAMVSTVKFEGSDSTEKTSEPRTENQHEIKVPIVRSKNSFSDLLDEMQRSEVLSGDNQYKRPEDNFLVDAAKTIKLQPKNDKDELVFSLKRFESKSYGRTSKNSAYITLDPVELDVPSEGGASTTKKQKYEPTAFILHTGDLNGGHYTTFIKEDNGKGSVVWAEYDDGKRKEINQESMEDGLPKAAKQAYVVKYSPLADVAEDAEHPEGKARYKSGLPESQTCGTTNKGSMGRNQCFANAAFAFLLSMTSLKPTNLEETTEALPSLDGLVTQYNQHLTKHLEELPKFNAHLEHLESLKKAKKPLEKTGDWQHEEQNFAINSKTPSATIKVTYCKPLAPQTLQIGNAKITQHWSDQSAEEAIKTRGNTFRAALEVYKLSSGKKVDAEKGKEEIIQTHLDVILIAANEVKKDGKSLSHDEVLEVIKFAKENGGVLNTQKPGAQQAKSWMVDFSRIYQDKMKESGIFTGRQGAYKAVGSRLTFLPADVLAKIQEKEFKEKFAGEAKTEAVEQAKERIAGKAEKMVELNKRTGAVR